MVNKGCDAPRGAMLWPEYTGSKFRTDSAGKVLGEFQHEALVFKKDRKSLKTKPIKHLEANEL